MSLRTRIFLTFTAVQLISALLSLNVVYRLMDQAASADNSAQASRLIEPVLERMREAPEAASTRSSQDRVLLDLYRVLAQAPIGRQDLLLKTMSLFFAYLLFQLVIMVLASAWLARTIARPLASLSEGIQAAATRSAGFRIEPISGREFERIGRSFNRLLAELDEQEARLREQARLAGWRDVAAYLSHQLRNSLTSLRLAGINVQRLAPELASTAAETAAVLSESLSIMRAEEERMSDLIKRFRASTTCPEPELRPLAVAELLGGVRERFDLYSIRWELDVEPGLRLAADRQLLEEALVNLCANSVQAWEGRRDPSREAESGDDRPVTIRMRAWSDASSPAWRMLEVSDSLERLSPELPARVLREPFTTKPGGWGLGLMFVRVVVAQHGGGIACRLGPRGGLVFTLRLPSGGR